MFPILIVQGRLNDLGDHLVSLSGQVHIAIADALSETVARIARDAVNHLLVRHVSARPVRSHVFDSTEDYDPWNDAEQEYVPRAASSFSNTRRLVPRPTVTAVT